MNEIVLRTVLLSHAAATLYMTGLIWFVQIVHYPLLGMVGNGEFTAYEQRHMTLTSWVVIPPMLAEVGTAALLLWYRPAGIPSFLLWTGVVLLVVIWLSTFLLQVPCHEKLASAFDPQVHRRLVSTNWIRTFAWTLRGLLALGMIWVFLKPS